PGSPPAATWSTCAPTAAPSCGCATDRPAARSTATAGPAEPGRGTRAKTAGRSSLRLGGSGHGADVRRTGGGGRGGPGRGLGLLLAGRPGGGGAAALGVPAADE